MTMNQAEVQGILDHMNQDHPDTLRLYISYYGGLQDVRHAELRAITRHEMRIHAEGDTVDCVMAIPLSRPVDTPSDARTVLVEMARVARQGLAEEAAPEARFVNE